MKKSKLSVYICMIALSITISFPSYADKESCPSYVVHCAYISGLTNNLNDGRYIKIYHSREGITNVICFNGTSTAFIDEWGAASFIGNNSDTYSICSDSLGKNCEQVNIDNFTITKNSSNDYDYSAKPQYFNLDLSTFKNKYPACDSLRK